MYGEYQAGRELRRDPFGALYAARKPGDKTDRYVVKTRTEDVIALADPDMGDPRAHIREFLASVELQSRLGKLPQSCWAPILATGDTGSLAFAVMELYSRTSRLMIDGRTKLDASGLYRIAHGTLTGLIQLQEHAGRPFGALRPANVLIEGKASSSKWRVRLSDPPEFPDGTVSDDLNALGAMLYSLVTHREWNPQMHPVRKTGEWNRLGSSADGWLLLVNQLLDPGLAGTLVPDDFRQQVERLGSGGGGLPIGAVVGIAAVAVIGLGVGGAVLFGPGLLNTPKEVDPQGPKVELKIEDLEAWGRTYDRWVRDLFTVYGRNKEMQARLGSGFETIFDMSNVAPPDRFVSGARSSSSDGQLLAARAIAAHFGLVSESESTLVVNPRLIGQEAVTPEEFAERVRTSVDWTLELPTALARAGGVLELQELVAEMRAEDVGWTELAAKYDESVSALAEVLETMGSDAGGASGVSMDARELLDRFDGAIRLRAQLSEAMAEWEGLRSVASRLKDSGDPVVARFGSLASAAVNEQAELERVRGVIENYQKLGASIAEELDEFASLGVDAAAFRSTSALHRELGSSGAALTRENMTTWLREARQFRSNWLAPADDPRTELAGLITAAEQRVAQDLRTIEALPDLSQQDRDRFVSGIESVREEIEQQGVALQSLRALAWTRGNSAQIQADARAIKDSVARVGGRLPDLIDDARLASSQSWEIQIQAVRELRLDSGDVALDQQWETYVNARVEGFTESERSELRAMSEELRALSQALRAVASGVSADRPLFAVEPVKWDRTAMDRMYAEFRADVLRDSIGQVRILEDRIELSSGQAADAAALRRLQEQQRQATAAWADSVRAIAAAYAELEQRIERLDLSVASAESPQIDASLRGDLGPVFAPIDTRLEMIRTATSSGNRGELVAIAGGGATANAQVPLLARYLAWQRLGEPALGWPSSVSELDRELDLQRSLQLDLEVIEAQTLIDTLPSAGQERWARAWVAVVRQGGGGGAVRVLDEMLARMGTFGLSEDHGTPLPAVVTAELSPAERFTLDYARTRAAFRDSDRADAVVQRGILEAIDALRTEYDDDVVPRDRVQLDAMGEQITAALGELDGGQPAGPSWDKNVVSPASSSMSWVLDEARSVNGDVLYFVNQDPESRLGRDDRSALDLVFRLVEPANGDSFFISTTEVPLAVLAEVVARKGIAWFDTVWDQYPQAPNVPQSRNPKIGHGFQVDARGQIELAADWLPRDSLYSEAMSPYPDQWRGQTGWGIDSAMGPSLSLPAHGLSVAGAITLANSLGCRVPTVLEWQAAMQSPSAALDGPNIADETLGELLTWQRQDRPGIDIWPLGDGAVFEGAGGSLADAPDFGQSGIDIGTNDGAAWFRVSPKDDQIRDLRGNLYEVVVDDSIPPALRSTLLPDAYAAVDPVAVLSSTAEAIDQIGLIGGSALSSTNLNPDQVMRFEKPRAARLNSRPMKSGHADIGVRLVFPGGRGSGVRALVDQLLDDPAYLF